MLAVVLKIYKKKVCVHNKSYNRRDGINEYL